MRLPLRPPVRNALLVLMCFGTLSIYVDRVVRVYLARRSADSSQVAGLKRAIRLVPDNAEFPHLLGLRLSASDQDDDGAIANLRKAVTSEPEQWPILA